MHLRHSRDRKEYARKAMQLNPQNELIRSESLLICKAIGESFAKGLSIQAPLVPQTIERGKIGKASTTLSAIAGSSICDVCYYPFFANTLTRQGFTPVDFPSTLSPLYQEQTKGERNY